MKQLSRTLMFALLTAGFAAADAVYNVTLDTQSLGSSTAGPFSLGFELAQGDQAYGNSAIVSAFDFGTGSPSGTPTLTKGSITGNLSSSVTLSDSSAISFFAQQFSPGKKLSFSVELGTNVAAGGIPDTFVIYLLDRSNSPIPTQAGAGEDYLVILDADSSPNPQTFAGDPSRDPVAGGSPISVSATISAVPEPRAAGMMMILLLIPVYSAIRRFGHACRQEPR